VTANRKVAEPKKPVPKPTAAAKAATVKPKKEVPASVKTVAAKPKTINLVETPQPPTSALEDISDFLDNLPLQACVELTRQLLNSISSHPSGVARPRAVLKPFILFVAEYGSMP
jgi:16S rRNA C1402 (ribose-2'-O) methylase RsmI